MKNIKENMIMEREMTGFSGAGGQQDDRYPETRDAAACTVTPKKKRPYERISIQAVGIEPGSGILQGSVTDEVIATKSSVNVTDFTNDTSWPDDSFDTKFDLDD